MICQQHPRKTPTHPGAIAEEWGVLINRDHHGHGTDIEKMQKHTVEKVKETHGTPASS